MNALATLRLLTLLVLFTLAASPASAKEGAKKCRRPACRPTTEQAAKPQRRLVAAFVDPTVPLAELVERERSAREHSR